jgi:geranylgeranyl diphosphate synthase, type I
MPKATFAPAKRRPAPSGELLHRLEACMLETFDQAVAASSVAAMAGPLVEELRAFLRRPGKRVRPLLLLHSCRVFGGDADKALPVAAALELLHSFILAHDDVIDRSDSRSGQPTLHRALETRLGHLHERDRAGRDLAVIFGDVLFSMAQRAILAADFPAETRLSALDAVLACLAETGLGECEDVLFGMWDISRVSPREVERMYWLKTTRYSIECPLLVGAILAGGGNAVAAELRELSRPLGLALQLRNDLQAFRQFEISDAAVPDDFTDGKKTLLMTTAFEALGGQDRRLLQLCLGQRPVTEAGLSILKELVVKSGAVSRLEVRAAELVGDATTRLASCNLPARARRGLAEAFSRLGVALAAQPATAQPAA